MRSVRPRSRSVFRPYRICVAYRCGLATDVSVVGLSVGLSVGLMAFGVWRPVGPSNHVLDGGPDPPPMVRGNFGGFLPH